MYKMYLSHTIDSQTPTYGNRNKFVIEKKSSIENGDAANDSHISTTTHIGTHIDMPYHFFEEGQTIKDFEADFFEFTKVLFVDFEPKNIVIKDDLISILEKTIDKKTFDMLVVKTGIESKRGEDIFWEKNYGFHPNIATYLNNSFPNIRVVGFDSISISSFANRILGREAHRAFLNPKKPILLLEDMHLKHINNDIKINHITIAPLRIDSCDGLPCTVIAEVE